MSGWRGDEMFPVLSTTTALAWRCSEILMVSLLGFLTSLFFKKKREREEKGWKNISKFLLCLIFGLA